jgi:predicted alpha/beta hydrolase
LKDGARREAAPVDRETHESGDGTKLTVEWFGAPQEAKAVVAMLPALGVNTGYYRVLGRELAGLGYAVATIPMRGEGRSMNEVRRHNHGYREVLDVDLASVVPKLQGRAQGRPFYLVGHSLGGQFALLYASRRPSGISGVALIAGGSNYYATAPEGKRLGRHVAVWAVRAIDRALGFFPGDKLGFGDRQPKNMMLDWTHEALRGTYAILGDQRNPDDDLAALAMPVLFVSLAGDRLVPASSAQFLGAKLRAASTRFVELDPSQFEARVDHFRWARCPRPVVSAIEPWLREVAQA